MQAKVTQIKNQSMYINHGIRLLDGTEPLYVLFGRVRERERKRWANNLIGFKHTEIPGDK